MAARKNASFPWRTFIVVHLDHVQVVAWWGEYYAPSRVLLNKRISAKFWSFRTANSLFAAIAETMECGFKG